MRLNKQKWVKGAIVFTTFSSILLPSMNNVLYAQTSGNSNEIMNTPIKKVATQVTPKLTAQETNKLFDFKEENEKVYDGTNSVPAYFKLRVDTTKVKLPDDWRLTEDEFVYIAMSDYIQVKEFKKDIGTYTLKPNQKFIETLKAVNPNLDLSELDTLEGTLKVIPQKVMPGAIEVMDINKMQDKNPETDPKIFKVKVLKGITIPENWIKESDDLDLRGRLTYSVPKTDIDYTWKQDVGLYPLSLIKKVKEFIQKNNKNYDFSEDSIVDGEYDIRENIIFEPTNTYFEIGKDSFSSLKIQVKTIRKYKVPENWGSGSGNRQQEGIYYEIPIKEFDVTEDQFKKEGTVKITFRSEVKEQLKKLNPDGNLQDDLSFKEAVITIGAPKEVPKYERKVTQANYGVFVDGKFASYRNGYSLVLGGPMKIGISLAGFKLNAVIGGIKNLFVLPKGLLVGHENSDGTISISEDPIADLTKQIQDSFIRSNYPYKGLHVEQMPNYDNRKAFMIWLDEGLGIDTLVANHVMVSLVSDGQTIIKEGYIGPISGHRDYGVLYAIKEKNSVYDLDTDNYPNTSEIASYYGFASAQLMNETYDNFTTKYSITDVIIRQNFKLKGNGYPPKNLLSNQDFFIEGPVGTPYDLKNILPTTIEDSGIKYILDEKSVLANNKIPALQGDNTSTATHITLPKPTEILYKQVIEDKATLGKVTIADEPLPETYTFSFPTRLQFLGKVPDTWKKISDGTYAVPKEFIDLSNVKNEVGTYSYRMNEKGLALLSKLNDGFSLSSNFVQEGTVERTVAVQPEETIENYIPMTGSKSSVALLGILSILMISIFGWNIKDLFHKKDE